MLGAADAHLKSTAQNREGGHRPATHSRTSPNGGNTTHRYYAYVLMKPLRWSRVVQACTAACGGAPAWARRLPERVKNAIFRTRNGSEARSPEFSGLRMRDGNNTNPLSQKHKRKRSFPKTLRRRRRPRLLHSLAGASALRSARVVVVRLWPESAGACAPVRNGRGRAGSPQDKPAQDREGGTQKWAAKPPTVNEPMQGTGLRTHLQLKN